MKISEQAAKAAYECGTTSFGSVHTEIIQTAINDHEKNLIYAAYQVLYGLEVWGDWERKLAAELDKRKENFSENMENKTVKCSISARKFLKHIQHGK